VVHFGLAGHFKYSSIKLSLTIHMFDFSSPLAERYFMTKHFSNDGAWPNLAYKREQQCGITLEKSA